MRKLLRWQAASLTAVVLLMGLFAGRAVWAATIWQPTNQDVNTLDFSLLISLLPTGNFYIFDDSAVGNLQSATGLQLASADQLVFSMNGANWDVTSTVSSTTLTLTGSTQFIFAERVGTTFSQETTANLLGPNNWQLIFGSGAQLQAVDVAPVPVPPAVMLMGSGLLGLLGIARRRKAIV